MAFPDDADVVRVIHGDDVDEHARVLAELGDDPKRAEPVLAGLATHRDRAVREWVALHARRALGDAAAAVLLRLVRDADPDVRSVAMEELLATGATLPESLLRTLRKRLAVDDVWEPIDAMWALAEAHDRSSVEDIRRAGSEFERRGRLFHRYSADAAVALLEGRHAEILDGIRRHEHERMQPLVRAARLMRTPEARAALAACAGDAPDGECRTLCAGALELMERTARAGQGPRAQ